MNTRTVEGTDPLAMTRTEINDAIHISPEVLENPTLLNEAWIKLPGQVARLGVEYAKSIRAHRYADRMAKATWAAVRERVRVDCSAKSTARITLAEIDAQAFADPAWQTASAAVEEAERQMETWRFIMEAMRAKRDALNSLSASMRLERTSSNEPAYRVPQPKF